MSVIFQSCSKLDEKAKLKKNTCPQSHSHEQEGKEHPLSCLQWGAGVLSLEQSLVKASEERVCS